MYTDNSDFVSTQVLTGLRFTFGASGAITLNYRNAGNWSTTSLTSSSLTQGIVYTIEIIANNKSSGVINYSYNGISRSVAVQRFDLYINGSLIGDDLNDGELAAGSNANATTFIGVSSTSNVANIFVDDVVIYNAVPASIGTSTPTINTTGSLTPFSTESGAASAAQNFNATGANLTQNITVTAPADFEVATDGATFGDAATITQSGGSASGTVSVRIKASATAGSKSGNIVLSSAGAADTNVPVSGNVIAAGLPRITLSAPSISNLSTSVGVASVATNYVVTGTNLGSTNVTITPSQAFLEVGTNGTTFAGTIDLPPTGGVVSNTVFLRVAATNVVTNYSASISHVSGSATNSLAVSGAITNLVPVLAVSTNTLSGFTTTTNAASAPQIFTVTGTNLTSSVTVGAPAGFEVANDGIAWGTNTSLVPVSTAVSNTVSVRLAATNVVSAPFGSVAVSSAGATTQNVTVSGAVNETPVPFVAGNLVVARFGDGAATLSTSATPVSVVEITPAGSTNQVLNTITTGTNLLTDSGNSGSDGYLNSYGNNLALPGYNTAVGTPGVVSLNTKAVNIVGVTAAVVGRVIFPTTGTPLPFSGANFRSVIATDTNKFYATGNGASASGGVWYYDGATYTQISTTVTNTRNVDVFNGNLYFSTSSGTGTGTAGIYQVGTGLPTAAGQTSTNVIPTGLNSSPYGFAISPSGDTAYVADDGVGTGNTNSGLHRYTNSGGTWSKLYTFTSVPRALGVTVDFSGAAPVVFATTANTNTGSPGNSVIKLTDTGSNASATTIATAGTNFTFRGIDFAPALPGPSIAVSTNRIAGLSAVLGGAGTAQSVQVSGTNLIENVTVTANDAVNFAVSTNASSGFTNSLVLTNNSGVVSATPLYVRLTGANAGSFSNTVSLASSNAPTRSIAVTGTVIDPNAPVINVSTNALTNFTATRGSVSAPQPLAVTGVNMGVGNITVTSSNNFYEISTDSFDTPGSNSLTLASTGGVVAVRISTNAPTSTNLLGNLALSGAGAINSVSLNGVVTNPPPSVAGDPTALSNFRTPLNVPSDPQSFVASGINLTTNITVTAPANFAISFTNNGGWTNSALTITNPNPAGGATNRTVFVRMTATNAGQFSNNVTLSSGSGSNNVAVIGEVLPPNIAVSTNGPLTFGSTTNVASPAQFFIAGGSNLSTNITVTAPTGFSVAFSSNNADFTNLITLTNLGGTATNREIFVRMNASAVTNTLSARNVTLTTTGVSNQVTVSGTITTNAASPPSVNVTPLELTNLRTTQGTQSAPPSTFTLTASNLQGPVTVSAVSPLLVSTDGGATYAASAVVSNTPAGTASNTVRVVIGASNALVGTYTNTNGITFSTPGATSSISGLSVVNGNFSNFSGLTPNGTQWANGLPAGWSTANSTSASTPLFSVFTNGGVSIANLETLGRTAGGFNPLYQTIGSLSSSGPVTLTFQLFNDWRPTNSFEVGAAIYNWTTPGFTTPLANGVYTNAGLQSLQLGSVGAGIPLAIAFWSPSGSPGLDNVTVSPSGGGTSSLPSIRTVHTVLPGPSLSAVPTALSNFSTVVGVESTNQSFNLSASNLLGPVNVSVTNGYEISLSTNSGFATNLTVALTSAFDVASNYTTATWTNGANGGSGFGPWALPGANGGTGFNGAFIGPATNTLSNYAPLYTGGVAFSIYAGGSGSAYQDADRTLSRPLAVGETLTHSFGIAFDNGNKGFDLYEGTNQVFNFNVNSSGYSWTGGNTAPPTPYPTNREFGAVINFAFTRTTNGFTYAISSLQDTNLTRSGSLTNGGIDRIKYYISGAGGGDPGNIYFNNFRVAYAGGNISNLAVYVRLATNAPVSEATNSLLSRVAISSPLVASAPALISYVGSETGLPGNNYAVQNWSNPGVAKAYDIGGTERYGTAGYYQIRPTPTNSPTDLSEAAGAGNNFGIGASTNPTFASAPILLGSATGGAGNFVNFGSYSTYRGPDGVAIYRQGALSVQVDKGPFNSPAGTNASYFGIPASVTLSTTANFRLGLAVDSVGSGNFAPNYISVYNPATGSIFSGALTRDGNAEMAFFDIQGSAGDTFDVALWQNTGTESVAALSLITFDAIPNPGGTTNIFVNLSGTVADRPSLTAVPSALSNLITTNGYASAPTNLTVTGRNLTSNVTLTVTPTNVNNFELSTNGLSWTNFLSFVPTNRLVSNNVLVRITQLAPVSGSNALSGQVNVQTLGARSDTNVSLLGTVLVDSNIPSITASTYSLSGLGSVESSAGPSTNFTVSGTFLRGPITVTAGNSSLAVSTNNLDFGATVSLPRDSNNVVISNPVYVRITEFAPVSANTNVFLGNLLLDTTRNSNNLPAPTNVAVSGTVTNWSIANPYSIRVTNPFNPVQTNATTFTFRGQIGTALLSANLSWSNWLRGEGGTFAAGSNYTWAATNLPLLVGTNTMVFGGQYQTNAGSITPDKFYDTPQSEAYGGLLATNWANGSGGSGNYTMFGNWVLNAKDEAALWRANTTNASNINVIPSLNAFALASGFSGTASAYRSLPQALQAPGGSFRVYFGHNDVLSGGSLRMNLVGTNAAGRYPLFSFAVERRSNGIVYQITDAANAGSNAVVWSNSTQGGLLLSFAMTSSNAYEFTAQGLNLPFARTNTGIVSADLPISGVEFRSDYAGPSSSDNAYNLYLGYMWQTRTLFSMVPVSVYAPAVDRMGAPDSNYNNWARGYGLDPEGGGDPSKDGRPSADPDKDGFSNDMEYAFGTNPTLPNGTVLTAASSGTNMVATFMARTNGVTYTVQERANLAAPLPGWTNSPVTISNAPDQTLVPTNYLRRSFSVPVSGNDFFRIRATITD